MTEKRTHPSCSIPPAPSADVALPARGSGSLRLHSWPQVRAGVFLVVLAGALLLSSCAAYKATLTTRLIHDEGLPTEHVEETTLRTLGIKTALVSVAKDEQSSQFRVDESGVFDMRTGGSGEAFDGVTGPVRSLESLGETAREIAPFVSQYALAKQAAERAAGRIAETLASPTPTPIPPESLAPLNSAPGTEALEGAR